MPKKEYTALYAKYAVCVHADCQCADTCLRHIGYNELLKTEKILRIINPTKCTKNDKCHHYRNSSPVTYARGFTGFQEKMYPAQYETFRFACIGMFGRNGYFMRRRGAFALPPLEQEMVLQALRDAGVTEDLPFDSYEERLNWVD